MIITVKINKFKYCVDQIRVIWSPKLVLFEKKVNKCCLWNKKLDIYQRGITFEGHDFYSDYCITYITNFYRKTSRLVDYRSSLEANRENSKASF